MVFQNPNDSENRAEQEINFAVVEPIGEERRAFNEMTTLFNTDISESTQKHYLNSMIKLWTEFKTTKYADEIYERLTRLHTLGNWHSDAPAFETFVNEAAVKFSDNYIARQIYSDMVRVSTLKEGLREQQNITQDDKTRVLKRVAESLAKNYPNSRLLKYSEPEIQKLDK